MSKTYRPKKSDFWGSVCSLAFFAIVGALSVAWCLFEPKLQGAEERFGGAAVVGLFWSAFAALSLYETVAWHRKELTLSRDGATKKGLLGETTIPYDGVREARWGIDNRRKVELRGKASDGREASLDIHLAELESRQTLELIRALRANLPNAEHVGWERFCRQYAIPLRDTINGARRQLRSDETRLTRRRWALIFAPSIVVSGLVAVVYARLTGSPAEFVVVLLFAGMWALLHFAWPREGQVVRRRTPEEKRQIWFLGGGTVLFIVGFSAAVPAIECLVPPPWGERVAICWFLGVVVAMIAVFVWAGSRLAETRKERETVESFGAAEEWEEGEQIVFVERGERFL